MLVLWLYGHAYGGSAGIDVTGKKVRRAPV